MVVTSEESQGPLLWLNSRVRVRHSGGIWTLVVRRVSNQYSINSYRLFKGRYFICSNLRGAKQYVIFANIAERKTPVAPTSSAREECFLFPLPKGPWPRDASRQCHHEGEFHLPHVVFGFISISQSFQILLEFS